MTIKKLLVVLLCFLLMIIPVQEAFADSGSNQIIQPRNELTASTTGSLTISSSGTAYVGAEVISKVSNTTKVFLHVYLQQYVNGTWQNYRYWPASSQSDSCSLYQSVAVNKGYSYRVKVSSWVMANGNSEQIVVYTGSKWY